MSSSISTLQLPLAASTTKSEPKESTLVSDAKKGLKGMLSSVDSLFDSQIAQAKAEGMDPVALQALETSQKAQKMQLISKYLSDVMKSVFEIFKSAISNLRLS